MGKLWVNLPATSEANIERDARPKRGQGRALQRNPKFRTLEEKKRIYGSRSDIPDALAAG